MAFTRDEKVELRRRAWELRLAGATQHQIAAKLNVSQPMVCMMLKKVREEVMSETRNAAQDSVTEEVQRLDRMLLALWEKVRNGHERAIDTALKVSERRAKLLGLDAVTRQAVDLTTGGAPLAYQVTIPLVQRIEPIAAAAEVDDDPPAGAAAGADDGDDGPTL